ncbi:MAG TPA: MBL fold metallo-hydrolase, partial [Candidatus Lokiarchaeia archaeon]|nr:MBL fold metallo-hydrolase [Candidatus Lokiarchaeia archaeon]
MALPDVLLPVDDSLPGFYFLPGQNGGRYPNSNSLLITSDSDGNDATLLDCGAGRHTLLNIMPSIRITQVLLSHWHEDHV